MIGKIDETEKVGIAITEQLAADREKLTGVQQDFEVLPLDHGGFLLTLGH